MADCDCQNTIVSIVYRSTCDSTIVSTDEICLTDWPPSESEVQPTSSEVMYEDEDIEEDSRPQPKWRKQKKTKPKIRSEVKIHNPPGGWGLTRV